MAAAPGLRQRLLAAAAYQWEGPPDLPSSLRLEWRFIRIRWLGILCVAPGILLVGLPLKQLIGAYVVLLIAGVYNVSVTVSSADPCSPTFTIQGTVTVKGRRRSCCR